MNSYKNVTFLGKYTTSVFFNSVITTVLQIDSCVIGPHIRMCTYLLKKHYNCVFIIYKADIMQGLYLGDFSELFVLSLFTFSQFCNMVKLNYVMIYVVYGFLDR